MAQKREIEKRPYRNNNVIISALLMTLLEEKTNFKYTKKLTFAIALTCIGVWIYQPKKKEGT